MTTLIISKEDTYDIMLLVNSREESGLLIKDVSETKQKNKMMNFLACN